MRRQFAQGIVAVAAACGCWSGTAFADPAPLAIPSGTAAVQPPRNAVLQSNLNAILNWSDFSIDDGEAARFIQPPSNVALNRIVELGASTILGSLRDNGQLFLVNSNSASGGTLTLAAPQIDVSGWISVKAGGNITLTASSGYLTTGYETRPVAGAVISVIGAGDTVVTPPASHVFPESGAYVQLTGGAIEVAESYRRLPYFMFDAGRHYWNAGYRWNEWRHGYGGHHENDGHHWNAGHHWGNGHHWNIPNQFENCDISPAVPEPEAYALMLTGLLVLWAAKWRRKVVL